MASAQSIRKGNARQKGLGATAALDGRLGIND